MSSTHDELLRLTTGCWVSQAIYVAAKLGIADLLQDGPQSCVALAGTTKTDAGALYRVLRALANVGIFAEDQDRHFCLTPLATHLQTDAPGSLRAFAILLGTQEHSRAWEGLLHTVKTGQPAFEHVFGMPLFHYLAAHPEAAQIFDDAMTSRSGQENAAIVSAYDFSGVGAVVDVGGGQGTLLASILDACPAVSGILVDLPHVIEPARGRMECVGRCEFVAGDFFSAVPARSGVYMLKRIIHDWDDERAALILVNCHRAICGKGLLLLIEPVIPPGNERSFNKLLDLLMLVWHAGGRERTESEHRALLASAGFRLNRVIPTRAGVSIVEAVPV